MCSRLESLTLYNKVTGLSSAGGVCARDISLSSRALVSTHRNFCRGFIVSNQRRRRRQPQQGRDSIAQGGQPWVACSHHVESPTGARFLVERVPSTANWIFAQETNLA